MNTLKSDIQWFFVIFDKEFRQTNTDAFEVSMFVAVAHFLVLYNPRQLSDHIGIGHQGLCRHLKELSLHTVKKLLIKFMVRQAAGQLRPVLEKRE